MALEKIRRFVFALAAVALFLATVMPSVDASANAAASAPTMTMAAMDGMDCPDRDTSRNTMVGCMQAMCIGFALIADDDLFDVLATHPAYAIASMAWPDDFESVPSTPPI
jgi:hypothetical protein